MTELVYYVNGEYVDADAAVLPVSDLGLLRGYGVFDFLRTYGYVPFGLDEHLARLEYSARSIGIELPWSLDELREIVMETYRRNEIENASIRILVTGGASADGMTPQGRPSLVVMVQPVTNYPDEYYVRGCKTITVETERLMPTVKSINYIPAILAMAEARKVGAVEAIYRDPAGYISEGTRANFFVFRGDVLSTPKEGVLGGITRQVVLDLAKAHFTVVEEPLRYDELGRVSEAFLTSTSKEIMPVVQVDGIQIGSGVPGPNTQRLMALFRSHVQNLA